MDKFLLSAGASLALAFSLAATPARAQLLGGGLSGGLGGVIAMPGGMINGAGDIGVSRIERGISANGSADAAVSRRVRTRALPAPVSTQVVTNVASTAKIAVPAVSTNGVTSRIVSTTSAVALPRLAVPAVTAVAVPDLVVRRGAIIDSGIEPVYISDVPAYVDRQYTVLQDDLRGTGVTVQKRGAQIILELPSDVNFAFNKYDIQPRFYGVLNAVSRTLAKYPATYVDVNGHTDAIGSFSYNQTLSERRADVVADYLFAHSVTPARLHVQGFGKTEPIASNATIEGRAANRRVEIVLTPVTA